jgi:signal transduction histidine kinase
VIDRHSLQFVLAWRLAALLGVLSALVVAALYLHVGHVEQHHAGTNSALVHEVLVEFFVDMAWVVPVIVALALAIGIWSIRRGLAPLARLSDAATLIAPGKPHTPLLAADVPSEVRPLVSATDAAFARLQDAIAVQSRFTTNAAHEMRTPLAVLRSGLEQLPDTVLRTSLIEDADRLSRLTHQLLDLARVEEQETVGTENLCLTACAKTVLAELAPLAVARNTDLALDAPTFTLLCRGRPGDLHAVMRNLVENAIVHTPHGSSVSVALEDGPRIIVIDDGHGIDTTIRARVFERFWRGPGASRHGSGLGLSIVAEAVRRLAADIAIDTAATGGARVVVTFPRPM